MKSQQKGNCNRFLIIVIDLSQSVYFENSLELFSELNKSSKETIAIANGTALTAEEKNKCTFNSETFNDKSNIR